MFNNRPSTKSISWIQTLLFGALIGVTVGVCIEMFISYFVVHQVVSVASSFSSQFANPVIAVFVARISYALLGALSALWSALIYPSAESDEKPNNLFKQTFIHILGQVALVYVFGLYLHWFAVNSLMSVLFFLAIFIVVYPIIWLAVYIKVKHDAAELNSLLEKRR